MRASQKRNPSVRRGSFCSQRLAESLTCETTKRTFSLRHIETLTSTFPMHLSQPSSGQLLSAGNLQKCGGFSNKAFVHSRSLSIVQAQVCQRTSGINTSPSQWYEWFHISSYLQMITIKPANKVWAPFMPDSLRHKGDNIS